MGGMPQQPRALEPALSTAAAFGARLRDRVKSLDVVFRG
jgi:hypothetical protein